MEQVAFEAPDFGRREHGLVNLVVGPARVRPVEEPQRPVGVSLAVGKPRAQETVSPRHSPGLESAAGQRFGNRAREPWRHALVDVQAQHPVVPGGGHGELLLPAEAEPVLVNDARAAGLGEPRRGVRTAGVDDEHFIGKADARQQFADLRLGVERNDGDREGQLLGDGVHFAAGKATRRAFYLLANPAAPPSTPFGVAI